MSPLARLALAGPVGRTLARLGPRQPWLRRGMTAVASRYVLASLPLAAAVIGGGAAWRYWNKRRNARALAQEEQAAAARRAA